MRKPRKIRKKETGVPKGYDSHFEARLDKEVLSEDWEYVPTPSPNPIFYKVEHSYHPDFVLKQGKKTIYLEAKGRFWDYQEYNKYKWIAKHLKKNEELVFLFAMPHAPMPATRRRKNGTKFSHREWAEKNGFRWYDEFNLPEEWKKDGINTSPNE
jgi:predicted nuclease of restriction endonuclease-like RecB superfamily